jgi:hypothetical protein
MGVWDYDLINDEFWISPELREIFAVGHGEFSPTYGGFLAFVHPEDRPLVVRAMTTSRENRTDYQLEHRLIRRDRQVRWIATRGRTFCDASGRAERMIGLVVDVTEFRDGELSPAPQADGVPGATPADPSAAVAVTAAEAKVDPDRRAPVADEKHAGPTLIPPAAEASFA